VHNRDPEAQSKYVYYIYLVVDSKRGIEWKRSKLKGGVEQSKSKDEERIMATY
jgi:hypothetical protein